MAGFLTQFICRNSNQKWQWWQADTQPSPPQKLTATQINLYILWSTWRSKLSLVIKYPNSVKKGKRSWQDLISAGERKRWGGKKEDLIWKDEEKKERPYLRSPLYLKQGTSGDIIRHNVGFPGGGVETGAKIPEHIQKDSWSLDDQKHPKI